MKAFLQRFGRVVTGIVSGFDRLFLRGTLRNLSYAQGMGNYLWANHVYLKDFGQHVQDVCQKVTDASLQRARDQGREIRYLNSLRIRPEDEAQAIAARDGIREGLICVLRRIDPCMTFEVRKDRIAKKLVVKYKPGKCLNLYHYQIHPVFGFMHARIQTWFPFHVYICINGREWLARQMDQAGLGYQRRDNCFTALEDVARAQALAYAQLQVHWPGLLNDLAASLNPIHDVVFGRFATQYYWSVAQSEWASDVMFRTRADLGAIYPRLIRHALTTYGAADVLRFLGRKLPRDGRVPASFGGQVQTDIKVREEGVRIKHWLNHNSIKLYDKGSVLRPEVTINDPGDFRVFRVKESDPDGPKAWRKMRWGVADMHRRAEVCQAANERYLDALAAVAESTPLRQLAEPLCGPVAEPRRATPPPGEHTSTPDQQPETLAGNGAPAATETDPSSAARPGLEKRARRRVRALNPLAREDAALLEAVSRHEFLINGLRNRDLRQQLFPTAAKTKEEERRRSRATSRKLRILRAHGLIHKVPRTHRYLVSPNGRKAITALLAARDANADLLTTGAA